MAIGSIAKEERAGGASESQILFGVSLAHLFSHVYMLTLPVMLPLLKDRLGVSFIELAIAITIFNVVSAVTQAPMGFLVDRIGPRVVLVCGLSLSGLSFGD